MRAMCALRWAVVSLSGNDARPAYRAARPRAGVCRTNWREKATFAVDPTNIPAWISREFRISFATPGNVQTSWPN